MKGALTLKIYNYTPLPIMLESRELLDSNPAVPLQNNTATLLMNIQWCNICKKKFIAQCTHCE